MEDKDKTKEMLEKLLEAGSGGDPRKAIKLGAALALATFGYIPVEVKVVCGLADNGLGGNDKQQYLAMAGLVGCAIQQGWLTRSEVDDMITRHRQALDDLALEEFRVQKALQDIQEHETHVTKH